MLPGLLGAGLHGEMAAGTQRGCDVVTETLIPAARYSLYSIALVCGHVVIYREKWILWCPLCRRWRKHYGIPELVTADD